jgi:hypothetical protein
VKEKPEEIAALLKPPNTMHIGIGKPMMEKAR